MAARLMGTGTADCGFAAVLYGGRAEETLRSTAGCERCSQTWRRRHELDEPGDDDRAGTDDAGTDRGSGRLGRRPDGEAGRTGRRARRGPGEPVSSTAQRGDPAARGL